MNELEAVFDKGLMAGLRSDSVSPAKEQRLVVCKNLKPGEFGLSPVSELTYPFDEIFIWPFPQMIMLRDVRLMATETAIYECDSEWNPTLVLDSLDLGDVWQVADFGNYILITNGSQMVKRNSAGVWSSFYSSSTIPGMSTICAFKGRVVGGNVTTGWEDCGESHVVWSAIGSVDFNLNLRNEAGYAPMSWNGAVLRVLPLGDMVIVYGENGVTLMKAAGQHMGFMDLDMAGIPTAMAVGGSVRGHLLVDYSGDLWQIGADGKSKKLGYKEYLSELNAANIVVSYNQQADEYYISDGDKAFIYNSFGLCQTHQLVSSLAYDSGRLYGTYESDEDTSAYIVTDELDFGQRAFKTISAMSAGCSSASDMWMQVYWRSAVMGTFRASDWQWVNPSGFVTPMVTAIDFKLAFKADNYADAKLSYIKTRLKLTDKRLIRGLYNAS